MNRITMTMSTPVAWPTGRLPDINDAVWATDDHELGGVADTSIECAADDLLDDEQHDDLGDDLLVLCWHPRSPRATFRLGGYYTQADADRVASRGGSGRREGSEAVVLTVVRGGTPKPRIPLELFAAPGLDDEGER